MMSKREMHKSISPLKKKKNAPPKPQTPSPRKKLPENSPNSPKIYDYFVRNPPRLKNLPLSRRMSVKKSFDAGPSSCMSHNGVEKSESNKSPAKKVITKKSPRDPQPSTSYAVDVPISEQTTQSLVEPPQASTSNAGDIPTSELTTHSRVDKRQEEASPFVKASPQQRSHGIKNSNKKSLETVNVIKSEPKVEEESFGRPTVVKATKRSLDFDSEVSPSKKRRISLDMSVSILLKNFVKFNQIYESYKKENRDLKEVKKAFFKIYSDEINEPTSDVENFSPDSSVFIVEKEIETITIDSQEMSDDEFIIRRHQTSLKPPNLVEVKTEAFEEVTDVDQDSTQHELEATVNENANFESSRRMITSQVTIERVTPKHDTQKKPTLKRTTSRTSNSEDRENKPLDVSSHSPKNVEKTPTNKPSIPRVQNGNSLIQPVAIANNSSSGSLDPMTSPKKLSNGKAVFKIPRPMSSDPSDALIFAITKSEKYLNFFFNNVNRRYSASYENLPFVERRIYFNLLGRKWYWLRKESIKGIQDFETALEPLFDIGFIKTMDQSCPLEDILQSMNVDELTTLCTHLNLVKTGTKENKIKNILQLANRKGFKFSSSSLGDKITAKAIEMVGSKTIKLTEEPRNFFLKLVVAATCPYFQGDESDRLSLLGAALGKLNKKEAFLLPLPVSPKKLFKDVAHFESYFKSVQMKGELQEAKLKKNWSKVVDVCKVARDELKLFLNSHIVLFMVDDYLRKFTAGSVLSYCLSSSIDVIKREKDYDLALECIELLLSQHHFVQRRRATWYEQKVLILERYRKSNALEIFEVLKKGLEDPQLTLLGRRILSKKAEPYANAKSKKLKADKKQELQKLMSIPLLNNAIEEIYCKSKPSVSTSKKQYFEKDLGIDILYGSVEEIASDYYSHLYPNRVHDEGRMLKNLALSLFYPVIYENLPGMFVSEMQDRPLDWGGIHFFEARKEKFMERKQTLINLSLEQIEAELRTLCNNLKNSLQILLQFDKKDTVFMMGLLKAMTIEKFTNAALYLFENFNERKSGLPDLTMYNDTDCAFVEVKGPTDTPSVNQILWLEKLSEFGFMRFICKVTSKVTAVSQKPLLGEETQSN